MKVSVIIPAAGQSTRFGGGKKKPFESLDGRAIWLRTVGHFVDREDVSEVVVVLAQEDLQNFREQFQSDLTSMNIMTVCGGSSRAESVQNGIRALRQPSDFIAVHDAARPLLTRHWVTEIFRAARQHHAAIPGTSVSSTVKEVNEDGFIQRTVDRTSLRLAQTPQVFRTDILQSAFDNSDDPSSYTDEASLVESTGQPVFVHEGWPMNIKITTRQDLELAEVFLRLMPQRED